MRGRQLRLATCALTSPMLKMPRAGLQQSGCAQSCQAATLQYLSCAGAPIWLSDKPSDRLSPGRERPSILCSMTSRRRVVSSKRRVCRLHQSDEVAFMTRLRSSDLTDGLSRSILRTPPACLSDCPLPPLGLSSKDVQEVLRGRCAASPLTAR